MKRRPVEWLPRNRDGDDEGDDEGGAEKVRSMTFTVIDHWVATDADQLLLPVRIEEKSGVTIEEEEGYTAILKQYGGESLLNDLLMADQDLDRGSRWTLWRDGQRLTIEAADD